MIKDIEKAFDNISNNFIQMKEHSQNILNVAYLCIEAIKRGNKIIFCGNGGSASDSQHLSAELVGRYKLNRNPYPAIALTTDSSILTALANDFGYECIFERQVEALAKEGDILFGISTSGNSENIVCAFKKAKELNLKTVALTGKKESKLSQLADYLINVPSNTTNNIQEMHIAAGHLICEIIEKELNKPSKALFLDRDGIINKDLGYVYKTDDFELIEGIVPLCLEAQKRDYKIIVITNQSGVERGYYTLSDVERFNNFMKLKLEEKGVFITDIFYCPYLKSKDRKPEAGMFLKAIKKHNIDVKNSISLGDKPRDIEAGIKAGIEKNYLFGDAECNFEVIKIKNFKEINFS